MTILGPYKTRLTSSTKSLDFLGNEISPAINDISARQLTQEQLRLIVNNFCSDKGFEHLHNIDSTIFNATVDYFRGLKASWCNLPLTTRMISSPGEVYRGTRMNYTTDALPVRLRWFDNEQDIFLAESSQFYLELRLLIPSVKKVFCIYNSFRKEPGDITHLSEFQHIEFEGKIGFEHNVRTAIELLLFLIHRLLHENARELRYFRTPEQLDLLSQIDRSYFEMLEFSDALSLLHRATGDPKYKQFTMEHFGAWEEVKLTEITEKAVVLTGFPTSEVPFYHNEVNSRDGVALAQSADIILPGYREVIGSGVRIADRQLLLKKARIFNLPLEHYRPYLESRQSPTYVGTAGFGLGWQRFSQWLLRLPAIWNASHIPRTHLDPEP